MPKSTGDRLAIGWQATDFAPEKTQWTIGFNAGWTGRGLKLNRLDYETLIAVNEFIKFRKNRVLLNNK